MRWTENNRELRPLRRIRLARAGTPESPPMHPPLMGLRTSTECYQRAGVVPYWFGTPLFVVGFPPGYSPDSLDPEVFLRLSPPSGLRPPDYPLMGFCSPPGYAPHSPPDGLSAPAPSLGFLSPTAPSTLGVHFTRVCLTRYVPTTRFLTPSPVCSSQRLAGLFRPASALGVPPFRGFPSQEAAHASSTWCLPS
jgi:hypothetical protein